jgi:hypothetical protein
LTLVTPLAAQLLGVHIPDPFWPLIVAGFLWYASAILIVSSRDVRRFASIIYWEALLRFFAVTALLAYGFTYIGALPTALFAITDFAWGAICIVGLRRVTGRSHKSLLLDRRG